MKKLLKRILLLIVAIVVAIQIPFIYRRYKISQLSQNIAQLNQTRTTAASGIAEYVGVIHAHTSLGGHSTGGFDELINAANADGLDFVVMTEHWSDAYDTSALTLNGNYGRTLFVGGNEIDTADGDRFLMIPGSADAAGLRRLSTEAVIDKLHAEGRLAFITYPEKFHSWNSDFDGDEVFSLHTDAQKMNPFTAAFDLLWSFPSYPELTFASYFKRPDANLAQFDKVAAVRKVSLFPGTDAHSNIGFHLFGDDAGHKIVNLKLDSYATTFRLARVHIQADGTAPLRAKILLPRSNRGDISPVSMCWAIPAAFNSSADSGGSIHQMGDEIAAGSPVTLTVRTPVTSHIKIFRNGELAAENSGMAEFTADVSEPGAYRVEVYLPQLGPDLAATPWILSNAIYIR